MALKKTGSAAVILNELGHVLLVKHSYGPLNWELPGGGSDDNESPTENALREVLEETGLIVSAVQLTGIYHVEQNDSLGFVFLCKVESGTAAICDPAEITDMDYWPVDALPRPISDWTIQRIGDAIRGNSQPIPTVVTTVDFLS